MTVEQHPSQVSEAVDESAMAMATAAEAAVTEGTRVEAATETITLEPDDLIHELSRAMHAAILSQHQRMADHVTRLRTAQAEASKVRTDAETDHLKKASQAAIKEIDAWAKTATELIEAERVRRIDARREQLQAELARQNVIAEREMMAVDVALEEHQAALEAFFNRVERETDPQTIASLASKLPQLPSLSDAADLARRHAIAEFAPIDEAKLDGAPATGQGAVEDETVQVSTSRLMAVMDPEASRASAADAAPPWPEPRAIAVSAGSGGTSPATSTANGSDGNVAAVPAGSRTLLRSMPTSRPLNRLLSWDRKSGDDPDRKE
jgi:hypothetical protein